MKRHILSLVATLEQAPIPSTQTQTETIVQTPYNEARPATAELKNHQEALGEEIKDFNTFLRQEAIVQNVLDKEGRAIARDADDAAALVQDKENSAEKTQASNCGVHAASVTAGEGG